MMHYRHSLQVIILRGLVIMSLIRTGFSQKMLSTVTAPRSFIQNTKRMKTINNCFNKKSYSTDFKQTDLPLNIIAPNIAPRLSGKVVQSMYDTKRTDYPTIIEHLKKLQSAQSRLPVVAIGQATESPEVFLEELDKQSRMVALFQMVTQRSHPCYDVQDFFTTFSTKYTRNKTFIPMHFHHVPSYLDRISDVVVTQLSPMNEEGFLSAGTGATYTLPLIGRDKLVIAEVNDKMPRTYGAKAHISEIDYLVETSRPLFEMDSPTIGPVERKIGENVAEVIQNGDTLQVGIGAIPNAVLKSLENHKNIKIHSEMISDGVMNLYEKGVITPKIITGFALGTKQLYDTIEQNPDFQIVNIDYTNNMFVASQIPNLISINSILAIDLLGASAADRIPPKGQISGVGGHFDFGHIATRSILAFPSTTVSKEGGKHSKIISFLPQGSATTMPRADVDMVCTEYGIVSLKDTSVSNRAKRLISIAHPDFRQPLTWEAKQAGLI